MNVRAFVIFAMSLLVMAGSRMPIAAQSSEDPPSLTQQRSHYCGNEEVHRFRWRGLDKSLCMEAPKLRELANAPKLSGLVDDFMLAEGNVLLQNGEVTKALLVFQRLQEAYPHGILAMELVGPPEIGGGIHGIGSRLALECLMWGESNPLLFKLGRRGPECHEIDESYRRDSLLFRSMIERYPNMTSDHAKLGEAKCYAAMGQFDRALAILDSIIAESPSPSDCERMMQPRRRRGKEEIMAEMSPFSRWLFESLSPSDRETYLQLSSESKDTMAEICASYRALRWAYFEKAKILRRQGVDVARLREIRAAMKARGCPFVSWDFEELYGEQDNNQFAEGVSAPQRAEDKSEILGETPGAAESMEECGQPDEAKAVDANRLQRTATRRGISSAHGAEVDEEKGAWPYAAILLSVAVILGAAFSCWQIFFRRSRPRAMPPR